MHGNVIASSDPKSCVEEIEIGAKTEARAEDDKTAGETAAEEIRRAMERQCLRWERRRADLDIGDKESGKRHSSDNIPKRLETGSGRRENDKEDTLPENDEGGREAEAEEETGETKEIEEDKEVETWFEVGEARFEVVAPGAVHPGTLTKATVFAKVC